MELGTVISTFEGPSTTNFAFVVTNPKVRKGQFIQSEMEDGLLIGVVKDLTRANRYFERAESVAEYEKEGGMSNFPTTDWEYTIAEAQALGVYKEGSILRSAFPASPGAKVFPVDEELLKKFIGFEENGLLLGKLEHHGIDAKISMNRLLQKHLAILALSGAGKSHLASVLMEELLERKREHGRLALLIVDVHGEYAGFKASPEFREKTSIFNAKDIRIAVHKLSAASLREFLPELSQTGFRDLAYVIAELKKEKKEKQEAYGIEELLEKVESSRMKENVKGAVLAWLDDLRRLRLFGKADRPSIDELAKPGILSILDLSDIDNQKKKQLIVAYFARRLFRARKKERIPPFLLMLEESHHFAREKASASASISKSIIETIAREGRKFGASLCLISQRPVQLSTTALSQCNSHIIMRITNPYDLDHIKRSCEGVDDERVRSITALRVGDALIIGEALNYPCLIRVRQRRSKKSTKGASLESIASTYENMKERNEKDVEAFL